MHFNGCHVRTYFCPRICLCRSEQSSAVWATKRPLLWFYHWHSVPDGHNTGLWNQRQVHQWPVFILTLVKTETKYSSQWETQSFQGNFSQNQVPVVKKASLHSLCDFQIHVNLNLTSGFLTLQDPGSSAVGSWLVASRRSQDERPRGICGVWGLLFLCFVQGVWPPHAFAVPPPLCGGHPVAQLRAACWLRPARAAQQRALWVSSSLSLWQPYTHTVQQLHASCTHM